ncbi:type VII secretion target [Mycobacterium sp.]|uniref:type VII secretion target n=1 Tax=Mycobacterium sp. TaxID=1785 RepID=UPI0031D1C4E8
MSASTVNLDYGEWHEHARWWDNEGRRIRGQLTASPEALESAGKRFGAIGWEVCDALTETLHARSAAGHALGQFCEGVARHIRSDVSQYEQTEAHSQQTLST